MLIPPNYPKPLVAAAVNKNRFGLFTSGRCLSFRTQFGSETHLGSFFLDGVDRLLARDLVLQVPEDAFELDQASVLLRVLAQRLAKPGRQGSAG